MVDPKPRRRIVPIQIAASPTIVSNQATVDDEAHVEEVCPGGADLQAQAEYAAANLGADRKLYVDLSGLEPSKPMVDWKEVGDSIYQRKMCEWGKRGLCGVGNSMHLFVSRHCCNPAVPPKYNASELSAIPTASQGSREFQRPRQADRCTGRARGEE